MRKIFKFLVSKKKIFPPKKSKILVIDSIFFNELSRLFSSKLISMVDIRLKEINLYVIYFTLFKLREKLNFQNYLKNYVFLSKCEVVITGNDNYPYFYSLKDLFPKKKFISIQNGFRNFLFFESLKKYKNLKADFFFGFNESFCKLFKQKIKTKTIAAGSFRNNCVKLNLKKKSKSILYVSTGNPGSHLRTTSIEGAKFNSKIYFKDDLILIKLVSNYCLENNLKLNICSKFNGAKGKKEIVYYKNLLKNSNVDFFMRKNKDDVSYIYELSDKNLVTISTSSTFGLENLSRKNKTAIFITKSQIPKNPMNILWNYNLPKKGSFWSSEINKFETNRILDFLIKSKKPFFNKKNRPLIKKLMIYDFKNNLLVKKINELLKN